MPSQISNASAIRAAGYSIRAHASFVTGGAPILEAEITAPPPVIPAVTLIVSITSGDYNDLRGGMRIDIYTASMGFKGTTRVRFGNVNTANVIHIRETGNASINIEAGDLAFVYDDIRLLDKLPVANETFAPDSTPYTDQGSNPPPVACSGGHVALPLDVGQTYATVLTNGSASYNADSDSTPSNVSHLWEVPTGVTFAPGSSSTDADPTLRAEVGEHVVHHTVTDNDNSKSTTQNMVVIVENPQAPSYRILYTPDTATVESGFGGTIQVLSGDTSLAAIPDLCIGIVWGAERVNGQAVSYRNAAPGRSHILAVGIVRRDRQQGAGDGTRVVTFELISPLARLRELTSYSKVMEANATPDAWSQIKALGVKRAIIQLIQFYTTLIEAGFDLLFDDDFIDYLYPAFYLQRSTFYGQALELAEGVDARLTCDRTGRFDIHTDPKYIPFGDRASVTKTWTFARRDMLTFELPREHADTVEQMKTNGFTGGASSNVALYSLYPSVAPGEAVDTPTRTRLIVTDQDDLDERTGRYGAAADVIYQDIYGQKWRAFPLTLTLRGVYDFFDFSKEYADFSENLRDLARDVDLTDFLFCVQSISWEYNYEFGTATTTVVFDVVTHALAGESYYPPPDESIPPSTLPTFPPITLPDLFPGSISRGAANMAVICVNGVFLTALFYALYPTWYSAYSKPWSGTLLDWCPNGFAPGYGWVVTTTELGYLKLNDGTYAQKHAFGTSSNFRSLDASFAESGFVVVNSYYPSSGGTKALWSTDNSSFTETTVNSYDSASSAFAASYVSSKVAGKAVVSVMTGSGTSAAYVTSTYGSSWATLSPAFQNSHMGYALIHSPWHNNPSDNIYYYPTTNASNNDALFRNSTDVSPLVSTNKYTPVASRRGMDSSVTNRQRILMVGERDTGSFADVRLFLTNNAGDSWTDTLTNTSLRRCALSGNDQNRGWVWGSSVLQQVDISGNTATLSDRMGNLASLTPGEIIGLAGV